MHRGNLASDSPLAADCLLPVDSVVAVAEEARAFRSGINTVKLHLP